MGRAAHRWFSLSAFSALLAAAALALGLPAPALGQGRHAIVIGAESYPLAVGPAAGARADASHVAEALQAEGFEVALLLDPDEAALKRSVFDLVDRLNRSGAGSTAVFYFVGQGVQINGDTFLLPIDARTSDDLTVSASGLAGPSIAERLGGVAGATSVIVIDAASPNNLTVRFDLIPGLAAFDAPSGGLVMFSHYPDQVAVSRQNGVSVFARAFADLVHDPQTDFSNALQAMRRAVNDGSGGDRYAWISGGIDSRFTLSARAAAAPGAAAGAGTRSLSSRDASPTPVPATRSLASPAPAAAEASATADAGDDQIHLVEVFFGTDRVVRQRDGSPEFTSRSTNTLTFGVAEVSIPPKHVVGQLESPRWWRFEFSPDPERHVVYRGSELREEDVFFDEVRAVVEDSAEKQAFVFIHGFNTSFENAARRTAQMHHDLNFDGAPIFYSWPSEGSSSPLAYAHDGNAADRTVPRLQQFLMMVADRTGAEKIHLIAHSMGNRALVDALDEIAEDLAREGREAPFSQIILSAPDIDRDVFMDIAEEILPTGQRLTLYASANDQALRLSREFNGNPRAGDSSQGIVIVAGLNTIDASDVRTELFDIGHDYYADDTSILNDMAALMRTNAEPAARGLQERFLPPGADEYWVILRSMFRND